MRVMTVFVNSVVAQVVCKKEGEGRRRRRVRAHQLKHAKALLVCVADECNAMHNRITTK
jgi:hypothetical protein